MSSSPGTAPAVAPQPGLVSVVIPCYNQAHFLCEAIESVLGQDGCSVEVIVVDDGSHDNTSAVARRYPSVRCIRQHNQGLAPARNQGLASATGEFLVFLDADDLLLPGALATGLRAMEERPDCVCVFGHSVFLMSDGSPAPRRTNRASMVTTTNGFWPALPSSRTSSVLYRRRLFDSIAWFDPTISPGADYDLYYRVTRAYPVHCHGELVAAYRRHGGNMTSNYGRMLRANVTAIHRQRRFVWSRPR